MSGVALGTMAVAAVAGAGYSIYEGEQQKKKAKEAASKQEAIAAKQQKMIDDENAKQKRIADERRARMKDNELLTGTETGITDSQKGSLLS